MINKTIINSLSTLILVSGGLEYIPCCRRKKLKSPLFLKEQCHFLEIRTRGVKLGAAALGGVEIVWRGPSKEDDVAEQILIVEQFINEGVSGNSLSPLDRDALAVPVAHAAKGKYRS